MRPELQARIRIVQSSTNRWVKALRAAVRHPPSLAERGALLALEGPHLLREALRSGMEPVTVFFRGGEEQAFPDDVPPIPASCELLSLPPALFASATETETPQGVAALLPAPFAPPEQFPGDPLLLVLAGVQDPGNVGTLLRSAEAFGAGGALLLPGTATPWSGKALRASAGSALRLPLHLLPDAAHAQASLRRWKIRSWAAVVSGGARPTGLPLREGAALWIGNEGAGLAPGELACCDGRVTLPMPGPAESLNAAVAGSVLLYEAARQRAEPGVGKHTV